LLTTGWFPRGVPAPDAVMPSESPSLPESLSRLDAAIEAFEQKLASSESSWVDHPLLGSMTARQWQRFHAIHAAHHFAHFQPPTQT
jgi:hypothetical protein